MMHNCYCVYWVDGIAEPFASYFGARKAANDRSVFASVSRDTSLCDCKCLNCDETNPELKIKLR